jgi:hypothetical protein
LSGVTDEYMREMLRKTKPYTIVILRKTPKRDEEGADALVWEHGRRNFQLRRDGVMSIVCPITSKGDIAGLCIFNAGLKETGKIMNGDPAVKAGIFTYELHSARSFPGDALAAYEGESER